MNKGRAKLPHTPKEVRQLAEKFEEIATELVGIATQMEKIGLPEFSFIKGKLVNTHLFEAQHWMKRLSVQWERQRALFIQSQERAKQIAKGVPLRGRPRRQNGA